MDYLTFSVIMLLGQFSPGPDMLLLLRNALRHPPRAGIFTVAGIACGLIVHTGVALAGLAVAIRDSPVAYNSLLVAGGLWLLWLASRLLLEPSPPDDPASPGAGPARLPLSDRAAFLQGLITNLTNVKAVLFLAGVLVSQLGPAPGFPRKAAFLLIVVGQALVFWSLFVIALQRPAIRLAYHRAGAWINRIFGISLAFLGGSALWEAIRMSNS